MIQDNYIICARHRELADELEKIRKEISRFRLWLAILAAVVLFGVEPDRAWPVKLLAPALAAASEVIE